MKQKLFTITNNISEEVILSTSNSVEFILFVKRIFIENEGNDAYIPNTIIKCVEYINSYCDNLSVDIPPSNEDLIHTLKEKSFGLFVLKLGYKSYMKEHPSAQKINADVANKLIDDLYDQYLNGEFDPYDMKYNSHERKVYVIDLIKNKKFKINASDEEFMLKAEELGTVYSLSGFTNAFNQQDETVNMDKVVIRII